MRELVDFGNILGTCLLQAGKDRQAGMQTDFHPQANRALQTELH
jgi:hypothetical protein